MTTTMAQRVAKETLVRLLKEVGGMLATPAEVDLTGATALVALGGRASAAEVSCSLPRGDRKQRDEFWGAMCGVASRLGLRISEHPLPERMPPLPGDQERTVVWTVFGSLTVRIYDPQSLVLSGLLRGRESDYDDAATCVRAGHVSVTELTERARWLVSQWHYRTFHPDGSPEKVQERLSFGIACVQKRLTGSTGVAPLRPEIGSAGGGVVADEGTT